MRLMEFDYDYQTKSGKPIEFTITEDEEGDNNRGFQVDRIDAYVDGKHAGYLKLSWIPNHRFNDWYKSIFHFMSNIQGSSVIPYNNRKADISELSNKDLARIIEYVMYHSRIRFGKGKLDVRKRDFINNLMDAENSLSGTVKASVDRADLITAIEILEKKLLESTTGKDFKDFKDFHIDKPKVDYIRVFDARSPGMHNKKDDDNTDWSRQGIGTALYIKGAKYLKSMGLKLHASGLQSDEAKAAWQKLERMGIVEPGERRTINASRNNN